MDRITTLEYMILRDEGRGKSDTFIYTVPKANKVKAYCKLGKLEDIMEHFKINSIEQLVNILEAWYSVKEYGAITIDKDVNRITIILYISPDKEGYDKLEKALEVKDK